jgi:low temperature requirement protein LtrA
MASLVRPREVARSVAPIELFFDLVYVFTVGQLSSNLIGDVSLRGIVETLILALAVMYAWFMTVWTSNWLDVGRRPVQLMLLALMFATLLMATSVSAAFGAHVAGVDLGDDRAGLFVIGYLAIQVGRTLFAVVAFRGHRLHQHFVNALAWEVGTGLLWILGVFANGDARLAIWTLAVFLTYGGVIAGHPLPGHRSPFSSDSQIYAEHLLERFRLFFLIALGETVLTIGKAFVDVPVDAERLIALAAAFLGTVSLWWCYFHRAERVGIDAVRSAGDGSRLVAFGNYSLVAMVIGIIGIAVGDELAIAEPSYPLITTAMSVLIFGGPALFLLAQLAFFHQATGEVSQSRIIACIALAFLALLTSSFTLLWAVIAASLVLLGVAIADTQAEKPSTATL